MIEKSKMPETAQKYLLREIVKILGGPTRFSLYLQKKNPKLTFSRSAVMNWCLRGFVPLKSCASVAKVLQISPYALNHEGITQALGEGESWEHAVSSCSSFIPKPARVLALKLYEREKGHVRERYRQA